MTLYSFTEISAKSVNSIGSFIPLSLHHQVSSKETFLQIKAVFDEALEEADFKTNVMGKYLPEGARVTNFEPLDTSAEKLRKKYNNMKADWRKKTEAAKRVGGEVFLEREPRWFSLLNGVFSAASEVPAEVFHPASFVYRHQNSGGAGGGDGRGSTEMKMEQHEQDGCGGEDNFEPIILADDYRPMKSEENAEEHPRVYVYRSNGDDRRGVVEYHHHRDEPPPPQYRRHVVEDLRESGAVEETNFLTGGGYVARKETGARLSPRYDNHDEPRFREIPDSHANNESPCVISGEPVSPSVAKHSEVVHTWNPDVDADTVATFQHQEPSEAGPGNVLREKYVMASSNRKGDAENQYSPPPPSRRPTDESDEQTTAEAENAPREKKSRRKRKPTHQRANSCHRQRKQPHRELLSLAKSVRKFTSSIYALRKVTNENERQRDEMLLKFFAEQGERKRSHELRLATSHHHACAAYHTSFPGPHPHAHTPAGSYPDSRCCAVVYPTTRHRDHSESPYVTAPKSPTTPTTKFCEH